VNDDQTKVLLTSREEYETALLRIAEAADMWTRMREGGNNATTYALLDEVVLRTREWCAVRDRLAKEFFLATGPSRIARPPDAPPSEPVRQIALGVDEAAAGEDASVTIFPAVETPFLRKGKRS
jgi:hypothetical protein